MNAGDPCPECKAYLNVITTRVIGQTRKRYIGCRQCGYAPANNVQTVPLSESPRQPAKHWQRIRYYGSTELPSVRS